MTGAPASAAAGDVEIEWAVRDSLLAYLQRDPGLEVRTSGGASYDPAAGVRIPAVREADGDVVATGTVELSAHDGALLVPLVDVRLADGGLWIADPIDGPSGAPFRLLDLGVAVPLADGGVEMTTALAPGADLLFRYQYPPGAPFAPLIVRPVGRESGVAPEMESRS